MIKMWCISAMEYYSATNRNLTYTWTLKKKLNKTESDSQRPSPDWWLPEGEGLGTGWAGERVKEHKLAVTKEARGLRDSMRNRVNNIVVTMVQAGPGHVRGTLCKVDDCLTTVLQAEHITIGHGLQIGAFTRLLVTPQTSSECRLCLTSVHQDLVKCFGFSYILKWNVYSKKEDLQLRLNKCKVAEPRCM